MEKLIENEKSMGTNNTYDAKIINIYDMPKIFTFPKPVQKMLCYKCNSLSEEVFYFLISYMANNTDLTFERIVRIMIIWNQEYGKLFRQEDIRNEIIKTYDNYIRYRKGYTKDLYKEFGWLELNEKICDLDLYKERKINIPNSIIDKLHMINNSTLKIYIIMLLRKLYFHEKNWTKKQIICLSRISGRTLERNIRFLVQEGYVKASKVNRVEPLKNMGKRKIKYELLDDIGGGCTSIEADTLLNMLYQINANDSIPDSCLSVFILLNNYIQDTDGEESCEEIQERIGRRLNKSKSSISYITTLLKHYKYINKETINFVDEDGKRKKHCIYRIHK